VATLIDDYANELIDSDSERFMWVAMNMADEIAGIDLHELASEYATKRGRDEPNFEDYGDAVRYAIDRAEDAKADEIQRARGNTMNNDIMWKAADGSFRRIPNMTGARCQYGVEHCCIDYRDPQCTLPEGHEGPHLTGEQIQAQRELNKNPTLDAIRRIVREELRDFFGPMWRAAAPWEKK
jgi:hypothetical protein